MQAAELEALLAVKELILQLMLLAAGVFALVAGGFGFSTKKSTSCCSLIASLVMFGVSMLSGYIAFGAVISGLASGDLDVNNHVISCGGVLQFAAFLTGGGFLTYFIVLNLRG